jgi:hypothetical protein
LPANMICPHGGGSPVPHPNMRRPDRATGDCVRRRLFERAATVARQSPSCAERKNASGHSCQRPKGRLRQLWGSAPASTGTVAGTVVADTVVADTALWVRRRTRCGGCAKGCGGGRGCGGGTGCARGCGRCGGCGYGCGGGCCIWLDLSLNAHAERARSRNTLIKARCPDRPDRRSAGYCSTD